MSHVLTISLKTEKKKAQKALTETSICVYKDILFCILSSGGEKQVILLK